MAAVPIYVWNGTAWQETGPVIPASPIKYQASAPSSPSTGDIWVDSDGDVTTGSQQFQRFRFVASGGETSISGVDANGATLAYTAGTEIVALNGSTLVRGQDYTATNGTSITGLSPALVANDVVEVFSFMAFNVANTYTQSQVDGLLATVSGLKLLTPTSVAVGSGTGSANANGYVSFSGASSVSLNGVFSSTYEAYKVVVNVTSCSTNFDPLWFRLRTSGTDNSSNNYKYHFRYWAYASSGGDAVSTGASGHPLGSVDTGTTSIGLKSSFDVIGPYLNNNTSFFGLSTQSGYGFYHTGITTVTTSYDGCSIVPAAGTITGSIAVYGYKN